MVRKKSEVVDEFNISLIHARHGWTHLIISLRDNSYNYWVSDVFSDALNDVISLCDAVLENREIKVPFYDEPGGVLFHLKPNTEQQHLMALEIS